MKIVTVLFRSPLIRSLFLALTLLGAPAVSSAEVFVSVGIAPPPLPVYEQPLIPGAGYIWTPGYWAYGPEGYYWVPGTWVLAPYIGALWTPGYWGWDGGYYVWNRGYWGPRVGYYGGINYGFGYFGTGYHGGYWRNGAFSYNTAVNNVNTTYIRNVYNAPVAANTNTTRVSFNGGVGGIVATPTAAERLAMHDRHQAWTEAQVRHERAASTDRAQLASVNRGVPALTATSRPGAFREQNAAAVRGGGGGNKEARIERGGPQGQNAFDAGAPRGNKEARIERGSPQGQNAFDAGAPRGNKEARIERGSAQGPNAFNAGPPRGNKEARIGAPPQGQDAFNAGPPRGGKEARIERGAPPQGPNAFNAGPPRGNREARVERGGPPPNAGGGSPQTMARPPAQPHPQGQAQGQPHPQGQPQGQQRGGRGGEHHEEKQK